MPQSGIELKTDPQPLHSLSNESNIEVSAPNDLLAAAFRANPHIMLITTLAEGRYIEINPAFELSTGYSREEVIGYTSAELNIWVDEEFRSHFVEELTLHGRVSGLHGEFRRKDGEIRSAKISAELVTLDDQRCILGVYEDFTETYANNKRFRDFAESSSDWFWEMDSNLRFSWFSSRFTQITGVISERLLGKTREETKILEVDPKIWNDHLEILHAHRPFRNFVHPRTLTDGKVVWLSIDGQPRFTKEGDFLGYRGVGREITNQINSESALKSSKHLFETAFQISPALSCITLQGTNVVQDVNDAWLTTLGYERREVIGKTTTELNILEGGEQARQKMIDLLMTKGRIDEQEVCMRTRDGRIRELILSVEQMVIDGEPHLFWCGYDVTELNRQRKRLRQSAAVFENTAEAVIVMDIAHSIVDVNPAFEEITGYTSHRVRGQVPSIFRSDLHDDAFYEHLWNSVTNTGRWRGEMFDKRADGSVYPCWVNLCEVRDDDNNISNFVAVCTDIEPIKHSQSQLEHLAHHDVLTDLPNRLLFSDRLNQAIAQASRRDRQLAVIFLDLDNFKRVNDSLGHDAGDQLLRHVSELLTQMVRIEDTVARLGGDEFTILLEDINGPNQVAIVAEKLIQKFTTPIHLTGQDISVTTSMGIAVYPRDGDHEAALMRNADAAMYRAKAQGRNTYEFYTQELTQHAFERIVVENSLRNALQGNELELAFQPQFDISTGKIVGAEALLRWNHPELGVVSPGRFIPIAEESGLIIPIGEWVLHQACTETREWLDAGLNPGYIAVNIAGPQIQRRGLVDTVREVLASTGLPATMLELEITETFIMREAEQAINLLQQLRDMGVGIAIDDFGTGHSSLAYLKRLPVETLKIDQSFVRDLPDDIEDAAISRAIIALARSLGLNVIAEGVETAAQAKFLSNAGCQYAQGYFYNRPMKAQAYRQLLIETQSGSNISH